MSRFLRFTKLEWFYLLLAGAVLLFLLMGCTQADVDRAQVVVDTSQQTLAKAEEILAEAKAAEARVAEAVATARTLAEASGNEQAKALVAKADAALALASRGVDAALTGVSTAKVVVATADAGLQAAKASQAAGGTWLDLLIAGVTIGVPALGTAAVAIRKSIADGRALKQTVAGVEMIRENLGEAVWKEKAMPALLAAQDEAVRLRIAKQQVVSKAV